MRCGVAAFFVFLITRTWADPDLWGHLRFGGDIVRTAKLTGIDPYSFTSDKPWINHEWLAEALMYLSYAGAGNFGLIAAKTALVLVAIAAVIVALRFGDLEVPIHDLLIFLVVAGMFGRTHVFRPQVFSVVLFAILLLVITLAERGWRRSLAAVPLIFAAWVNLHGGWIVGAGVFAVWAALKLLDPRASREDRTWLAGAAGAALVAAFLNPYGWRLWEFLFETVGFQRTEISDWQPIWKLPLVGLVPWIAAAGLTGFALLFQRRRINPRLGVLVVLCGIGSAIVGRLDMFFTLSAVMLLGPAIGAPRPREAPRSTLLAEGLALGTVAILTLGFVGLRPALHCVVLDGTWQPEPEVVGLIRDRGLTGRMLTFFDWGEYAIWHTAPALKISFDGRRETVYSDRVIDDHLRIYRSDPGAETIVAALKPDYVWLPKQFGILTRLMALGWVPLFQGPVSTLLASPTNLAPGSPATGNTGPRCFPGP